MNKQYQRVLVTTPHPLLRLVFLGLVRSSSPYFPSELTRFGTLLAPLWFPTSIMMVAFYRHAGKCVWHCARLLLWQYFCLVDRSSHGHRSTSPINIIEATVGALLLVSCSPGIIRCKTSTTGSGLPSAVPWCRRWWGGVLVHFLVPSAEPLRNFLVWVLSEAIGALALVPLGSAV